MRRTYVVSVSAALAAPSTCTTTRHYVPAFAKSILRQAPILQELHHGQWSGNEQNAAS